METRKIVGIITARGGSKGIPKKNIMMVNHKPLLAYTIEAALGARCLEKVVVSSDDDAILRIAGQYGAIALKRPKKLASDKASSEVAIVHVLEQLKKNGEEYHAFVLLQPTSPLRDKNDIDAAIGEFIKRKALALISVFEPAHSPFKSFICNKAGFLKKLVNIRLPSIRRQDLPRAYMPNGAIYINDVKDFLKDKMFSSVKAIPFVMPRYKSVDIDTMEDVHEVEKILKMAKMGRRNGKKHTRNP